MTSGNPGKVVGDDGLLSILDIAMALATEWRIVAVCLALGLTASAIAYLGFAPTYTCSLAIQVGRTYGQNAPEPLEATFLAARRIGLRFGGHGGERIGTRVYEADFDLVKRLTLEITVSTASAERSLVLANDIVEFVRADHARRYQEVVAKQQATYEQAQQARALEQRLVHRYRDMYNAGMAKARQERADKVDEVVASEATQWAHQRYQAHLEALQRTEAAITRLAPVPTVVTLAPDMAAIAVSERDPRVFVAGLSGGLLAGILAGAVARAWRKRRTDRGGSEEDGGLDRL